ncbi:MAG TPA: nucleoside monophosphate kinase [Candidatus Pacearchaeota archaeon]|nr:nucleoside monophosphate kinase [Candidatus Pacearchaeota archaeon]
MKTSKIVVSLIGPPGSGKGTQADFLCQRFGWAKMASGDLLRERREVDDYTGQKIGQEMAKGELVPTLVVAHLWFDQMEAIHQKGDFKGLVIDGSPRRKLETELIKGALSWYGWDDYYRVVYLNISEAESTRRLLAEHQGRARSDDVEEVLATRWRWFVEEVQPTLEDLRSRGELIEINGEQTRPEVFNDILKALGLNAD